MFHPTATTAFRDNISIGAAPLRRAMVLGAMFGTACQGAMPLTRVLAALRTEADAEVVTLLRLNRDAGPYLVATTAARHSVIEDRTARFAAVLTTDFGTLVAGHVLRDPTDATQSAIVLQVAKSHADVLILRDGAVVTVAEFAAMAAPIWALRRSGLVINAVAALHKLNRRDPEDEVAEIDGAILSPLNPAGLTPAEITVAVLLRDGQSPAVICKTLAIAMPTVRTHLRNLYNKTGRRGMQELTHRLHADAAAADSMP